MTGGDATNQGPLSVLKIYLRYMWVTLGPLSVSVAHLISSLLLLRHLSPADFGLLAFVLVLAQFGFGVSNALAGTPLTLEVNRRGGSERGTTVEVYFKVNLIVSLAFSALCGAVAFVLGGGLAALPMALFVGGTVSRWFLRSYFFALHQANRALSTDVIYTTVLLGGLILAWVADAVTLLNAGMIFVCAAFAPLLVAGPTLGLFLRCVSQPLRPYRKIWLEQSRWITLGVVATEATTNAHAWLVTLVVGPVAFAPLAAASLLFRPISMLGTSLAQLERPSLVRALALKNDTSVRRTVQHFRIAMLAGWGLNAALAWWASAAFMDLLFPGYDRHVIYQAAVLWGVAAILSAWRAVDSTLLQAAGLFRPLSRSSVYSGILSLVATGGLLAITDPVFSIIGVVIGHAAFSFHVGLILRHWRLQHV